ncbi:MAG: hypothetical protein B0D91_12955 [Oceanospirillales bacterium LUC14_002_19_P2]|nr:MAG: hypothetical protein B0D91_12955 [Oceanospirillales bacterium LUC14_002_19_P2]
MTEPRTSTTEKTVRPMIQEKVKASEPLPEKASERSLYIRRAIEDHFEEKRLKALSDDCWWDNI